MDIVNLVVLFGVCGALTAEYFLFKESKMAGLIIPAVFVLYVITDICSSIFSVNPSCLVIYASAILSIAIALVLRHRQ